MQFYNHLPTNSIDNIKYYLLTSAKNIAMDFLKRKRVEIIYDENILNEELYECKHSIEYKELLNKMRMHLNDLEFDLILKHNLDNVTFKELSTTYNKPLNTILSIYHRALKKLENVVISMNKDKDFLNFVNENIEFEPNYDLISSKIDAEQYINKSESVKKSFKVAFGFKKKRKFL